MSISNEQTNRIIILLDMDCFYAQCETIRLGLDKSMPLCLLQWNSALAVNYPAREFGIKRGATFEEIQQMSGGKCTALHLPIISAEDQRDNTDLNSDELKPVHLDAVTASDRGDPNTIHSSKKSSASSTTPEVSSDDDLSVRAAYDREYNMPQEERNKIFVREKNKIRRNSEGKASLERYRLASARIFQLIVEALLTHVGKGNFILERASIDELFLDITSYCYNTSAPVWKSITPATDDNDHNNILDKEIVESDIPETVICADSKIKIVRDKEFYALRRGCIVAQGIRKEVVQSLGFTLSAGISTNKMMAKLCASYGKPAGQAIILPDAILHVMEDTKIKKVRNLGGKLGQQVLKLLPSNEDTMGSIARLLSLSVLCDSLGSQAGKMIFDACRGIDDEPVKETKGALAKSITAFKSFGETDYSGVEKWISVLTSDVINRINVDNKRNNRYPTTCVIHYYWKGKAKSASIRIPFPSKAHDLLKRVQETIRNKVQVKICRLGICAVGFEYRSNNGIAKFLQKGRDGKALTQPQTKMFDDASTLKSQTKMCSTKRFFDRKEAPQPRYTTDLHPFFNNTKTDVEKKVDSKTAIPCLTLAEEEVSVARIQKLAQPSSNLDEIETDLALAKKLQASYERENYMFRKASRSKKAKINHFFKPSNK